MAPSGQFINVQNGGQLVNISTSGQFTTVANGGQYTTVSNGGQLSAVSNGGRFTIASIAGNAPNSKMKSTNGSAMQEHEKNLETFEEINSNSSIKVNTCNTGRFFICYVILSEKVDSISLLFSTNIIFFLQILFKFLSVKANFQKYT